MTYLFDPISFNGTAFTLSEFTLLGNYFDFRRANRPIPASCFPEHLTVLEATKKLPDIFHTHRDLIAISCRVRAVLEKRSPGAVDFIPVSIRADPMLEPNLQLADGYFFIEIVARAQRLRWLEMPVHLGPIGQDGMQIVTPDNDFRYWKFRRRKSSEPLLWRENAWISSNKKYVFNAFILIEDSLWQELDENFPNQLHPKFIGETSFKS